METLTIKISSKNKFQIAMKSPSEESRKFKADLKVAFREGVGSVPSVYPGYFRVRHARSRTSASIGRYWGKVGLYLREASARAK